LQTYPWGKALSKPVLAGYLLPRKGQSIFLNCPPDINPGICN
jgi:hypothetical protein